VPYPAARIIARIFSLQRLTFHRRINEIFPSNLAHAGACVERPTRRAARG
jgi:hypothetical protein